MKRRAIAAIGILSMVLASFFLGRALVFREPAVQAQAAVLTAPEADPIDAFLLERQQLRQMQIAQLNELIASDDTEREIVLRAQRQLLETLSNQEKETTIEGVLRMRGYSGAVATVHEDSVNVLVRAESLSQSETAVILELVLREAVISGGNVKIIPII